MKKNITDYLENKSILHSTFLSFIDYEDNIEENYQNLIKLFDDQKILDNFQEIKLILSFISKIVDNHHRTQNFFSKIQRVLLYFRDAFTKHFSNSELFSFFFYSKSILLFLLKEKILKLDTNILIMLFNPETMSMKNIEFFIPEIKSFIEEMLQKNENQDKENELKKDENSKIQLNFTEYYNAINQYYQYYVNDKYEENRNLGENEFNICKMIQKDSIEEFITEYNKTNFQLTVQIVPSIFETNLYLIDKMPSLIEYASFFGSTQIFKFLVDKGVQLTSSLWFYGVHSDDSELISILEEKCPKPDSFKYVWIEAIKCHHNDVAKYIQDNYSTENCYHSFRYYNFSMIFEDNIKNELMLYYSCKYNYYTICEILLENSGVNINFRKSTWTEEVSTIINKGMLIKYKISKNLTSKKTPFSAACYKCNLDIIKLLVKQDKIDCNLTNFYIDENHIIENKTAFYNSVDEGKSNVVELLLNYPNVDINYYCDVLHDDNYMSKKTPLFTAVENGRADMVFLILKSPRVDINKISEIDIFKRTQRSHEFEKKTPLYIAFENKQYNVIYTLLQDKRIDVNKLNDIFRVIDGHIDYSSNSHEKTCYRNVFYHIKKYRKTVLHFAVQNNEIEMVRFLLSNSDIDVNIPCEKNTISYKSNCKDDEDDELSDVEYIFKCDQDEDDNIEKKTALHMAIDNNNIDIVQILLSNPKIDVNFPNTFDKEKKTALHMAVHKGNAKMVELLLSNPNIDVNIQETSTICNRNKTALQIAYQRNNTEIIQLLLQRKDIDIKSIDEKG